MNKSINNRKSLKGRDVLSEDATSYNVATKASKIGMHSGSLDGVRLLKGPIVNLSAEVKGQINADALLKAADKRVRQLARRS